MMFRERALTSVNLHVLAGLRKSATLTLTWAIDVRGDTSNWTYMCIHVFIELDLLDQMSSRNPCNRSRFQYTSQMTSMTILSDSAQIFNHMIASVETCLRLDSQLVMTCMEHVLTG